MAFFFNRAYSLGLYSTFLEALLHYVPVGKMVVLDLFAEVLSIWTISEQFYGVPYIWLLIFLLDVASTSVSVNAQDQQLRVI
ncbi:alpha-N-acetylglucosaminidase-like isoform X2 [Apium graveolens]|uniref:alpha-N-acetylglucosaminidase-like isoform X2 n=1 Tax=Apium graveolens TaxID=4045 RepID=UPI003D7B6604